MKQVLVILCMLLQLPLWSQQKLAVAMVNQKPFVMHTITNNQTIFTLSKMYKISLAEIANANNTLYKKGFSNGDVVYIPITKSNYLDKHTEEGSAVLEYKVANNETLIVLSRRMNVRQSMLQTWNDLPTPYIRNGQLIMLGWVKYTTDVDGNRSSVGELLRKQPLKNEPLEAMGTTTEEEEVVPEFEQVYEDLSVAEEQENGVVVFFSSKNTLKDDVYYAFHNTLPKGAIVKVINPLNNNTVYAKIIGAIPKLEAYEGAILVLSDNAVSALAAQSAQFFCNVFHK